MESDSREFWGAMDDPVRVAVARESNSPDVVAAGRYLRMRTYRLYLEHEHGDKTISFPQRIIEAGLRRRFINVAELEIPEGADTREIAPELARKIIDNNAILATAETID